MGKQKQKKKTTSMFTGFNYNTALKESQKKAAAAKKIADAKKLNDKKASDNKKAKEDANKLTRTFGGTSAVSGKTETKVESKTKSNFNYNTELAKKQKADAAAKVAKTVTDKKTIDKKATDKKAKTVIDKDGKTVYSKDGSKTTYNSKGKTVYNKDGSKTISNKNGVKKYTAAEVAASKKIFDAKTAAAKKAADKKKADDAKAASGKKVKDVVESLIKPKTPDVKTPVVVKPPAKTVSQIWKEKTGTEWSEAKKQGLSDGSAKSNLALLAKLKSGSLDKDKQSPAKTEPAKMETAKATDMKISYTDPTELSGLDENELINKPGYGAKKKLGGIMKKGGQVRKKRKK